MKFHLKVHSIVGVMGGGAGPTKPKAPVKKRTGRQETILTGGLSEGTTFKPTLLGQ